MLAPERLTLELQKLGYSSIGDFDDRHATSSYLEIAKFLNLSGIIIPPINIEFIFYDHAKQTGQTNKHIKRSMFRHFIRSLNDEYNKNLDWDFLIADAVAACLSRLSDTDQKLCRRIWDNLKETIHTQWRPRSENDSLLTNALASILE